VKFYFNPVTVSFITHTIKIDRTLMIFRSFLLFYIVITEKMGTKWPKVADVYTDITPICEALKQAALDYDHNSVSISFMKTTDGFQNKKTRYLALFLHVHTNTEGDFIDHSLRSKTL
jgi:hypothetical protein